MRCASDDDPLSTFSAENKSCFDHAHDGEPFCLPEHISWNCFLRHLLELANDRCAAIHSVLFGGLSHRHCERQHRNNKEQFFHRIPLRQCLSQRMYTNAIGLRRIAAAHVTMPQYFVWLRPEHLMTLHGKPEQWPLFRSKCLYGVHASGAVRREKTSKKRRACEHESCSDERQRVARTYVIQDFGQNATCGQ